MGKSEVWLDRWYRGDAASEILVGWELECLDTQAPTWQQIDSLAEGIVALTPAYGWRWPFVLFGHGGEAIPVGRRSDPRHLDWGALMGRLYVRSLAAGVPGM
jgi:hypothetical protein